MLESESEFLVKKWGWAILAFALVVSGLISILIQESYFPEGSRRRFGDTRFSKVIGKQAIYAGITYLGVGIALLGNFVVPYSERFHRCETLLLKSGCILVIVGVVFYISRFFY